MVRWFAVGVLEGYVCLNLWIGSNGKLSYFILKVLTGMMGFWLIIHKQTAIISTQAHTHIHIKYGGRNGSDMRGDENLVFREV